MKILLLGSTGQIGWELQRALAPLGTLIAITRGSGPAGADLSRPESLAPLMQQWRPQVIVNAAAYTAVDRAESEAALAETVNREAPAAIAREAAALGALLVHYSTDYVFDGSGDTPRDESAPTGPVNVYGRSKLAGEEAIRASGCDHLILRTSWVYAARGANFVRTMMRLAGEREWLTVVDDQIGAPTGADLLADATAHALLAARRQPLLCGTYHVTASGETSWHGYASFVVEWARRAGLQVRAERVEPVPSSAFATAARRPLNSRLATAKFCDCFGLSMPAWRTGVERMLDEVYGGAR